MRTWILEHPDAAVFLEDRGLTHGLGVFETMLAIGDRLIRPDLHFERLGSGCARLGIGPPDEANVLAALAPVLAEMAAPRTRVRVMRTAGRGGLDELAGTGTRTVLSVAPSPPPPESVNAITSPWPRNERSPLAGVKCASYAENLVALDHARQAGAEELIFPNTRGALCEAATANVFVVRGRRVTTPPVADGCLPGTARLRVIGLARSLGLEVAERSLTMDEARAADAIFLTSATRGVVRVSRWDARDFGGNSVTDLLRTGFDRSLEPSP